MRIVPPICAAAVAACLTVVPAAASINVYYHAGAWDAFDGEAGNGAALCGVGSENPSDGRSFSLSEQIGGATTTFVALKPGWKIPAGTRVPVVVQIGLQRPWVEQATGNGDKLEWTMDQADAAAFDAQFRGEASMTVTFPSGNEKPWIIALGGSAAVSNAMRRCITDLARRTAAPRPAAAPATPAQPVTQPFAAPSGAAQAPEPQQPTSVPAQPNAAPAGSH